jgi:hypothetical protein
MMMNDIIIIAALGGGGVNASFNHSTTAMSIIPCYCLASLDYIHYHHHPLDGGGG